MISDAELEVMSVLWEEHPLTAKQIIAKLPESLNWTDKTVKSLLNRLVKKQALAFEVDGREYLYTPLLEKQAVQSEMSNQVLSRLFNGKLSGLVSYFARNEKLSKTELEELEAIIKDLKQ